MQTNDGKPLLILDKVGEGRVAQLLSDNSWVWSRSINDKGPQSRLLRRTIHWLLKEPELQEENIITKVKNNKIEIIKNNLTKGDVNASVIGPDQKTINFVIKDSKNGQLKTIIDAKISGKYKITIGEKTKVIFVGKTNFLETNDIISTEKKVSPIASLSKGGVFWLEKNFPNIISVNKESNIKAGLNWLGIHNKNNYNIKKITNYNLIPWYIYLIILILLILLTWYRESKNQTN